MIQLALPDFLLRDNTGWGNAYIAFMPWFRPKLSQNISAYPLGLGEAGGCKKSSYSVSDFLKNQSKRQKWSHI